MLPRLRRSECRFRRIVGYAILVLMVTRVQGLVVGMAALAGMYHAAAQSSPLVLTRGPGDKVRLQYGCPAGQTNWISASSNLVTWTLLGSAVTPTNGVVQLEEVGTTQDPQRFYRVLSQAPESVALQFGLFVNWSNSSFTGRTTEKDGDWADWPSPYATPSQSSEMFFNPPGLEEADVKTLRATVTDSWVDLAKTAHMTHLLLVVKHVDGFCLWDSAASRNFCITCRKREDGHLLHSDLVKAVAESCAAKGMRLGFYYCLADQHDGWNTGASTTREITKRHLTELLGGSYGTIDYVFLDLGYGGQDLKPEGTLKYMLTPAQRQDLMDFIHGQGPDPNSRLNRLGLPKLLVGFNDPHVPQPGDYRCVENGHPELNPQLLTEFSFPMMSGPTHRVSWFYTTPEQENRCMSVSDLRDYYDRSLDCQSIMDLGVGPDHTGRIRKTDVETIRALTQALSDIPTTDPHHFLINDTGERLNGCPNGTISYPTNSAWMYRAHRGLAEYGDDAHITTQAGDSCEYQFTGTAVEVICSKSITAGAVDVWVDGVRQTGPTGLDLRSETMQPRQVVFAMAGLPVGSHTIKVVNRVDGLEVAIDAFRVYSGMPQSISVDNTGCVWVVDSEHLIWTYHPATDNAPPFWARMPGTARDVGCGDSVWKVGTDVPFPSLTPRDFSISIWLGPTYEWAKIVFGQANRIDVNSDGSLWAVNNAGEIGFFPQPPDSMTFFYAGLGPIATDVGCQSAGGNLTGKTGFDSAVARWNSPEWESLTGAGIRVDVASNGDLWLVTIIGDLWQYHSGQWLLRAYTALDVSCGGHGEVWFASTDGTIQRVIDP
jgi:alpha-L-fucosidase